MQTITPGKPEFLAMAAPGKIISLAMELYTDTEGDEQEKIEEYNLANPDDRVGFLSADNSAYDLK